MKGVNQYWRRRGWERVEFAASSERRHSNRSRRAYILWMYSRRLATYSLPLPLLLLLLFASLDEANGMETRVGGAERHAVVKRKQRIRRYCGTL